MFSPNQTAESSGSTGWPRSCDCRLGWSLSKLLVPLTVSQRPPLVARSRRSHSLLKSASALAFQLPEKSSSVDSAAGLLASLSLSCWSADESVRYYLSEVTQ